MCYSSRSLSCLDLTSVNIWPAATCKELTWCLPSTFVRSPSIFNLSSLAPSKRRDSVYYCSTIEARFFVPADNVKRLDRHVIRPCCCLLPADDGLTEAKALSPSGSGSGLLHQLFNINVTRGLVCLNRFTLILKLILRNVYQCFGAEQI